MRLNKGDILRVVVDPSFGFPELRLGQLHIVLDIREGYYITQIPVREHLSLGWFGGWFEKAENVTELEKIIFDLKEIAK